jgi:O-antigen ligase
MAILLTSGVACNSMSLGCGILRMTASTQADSNSEHIQSIVEGLAMFREHPLFGAGLGAFIASHVTVDGTRPLVLHSTYIWWLAEFGIVGATAFVWLIGAITISELRRAKALGVQGRATLFAMTSFGVMALVHELLYQRPLWFLIGAALATTRPVASTHRAAGQQIESATRAI